MIDEVLGKVRPEWDHLFPGSVYPERMRYVVQSRNKVIVFLFDPSGTTSAPVAVLKISRHPDGNTLLERSAQHMNLVRQLLRDPVQGTIPRCLVLDRTHGLSAVLEEAMLGDVMRIDDHHKRGQGSDDNNVRAFSDWLLEFQTQARVDPPTRTSCDIGRRIESLVRQHAGGELGDMAPVLSWLDANDATLDLYRGWRFGDSHHSNILMQDGVVCAVLDWDGSEPDQWCFLDWYQFAFGYARAASEKAHPRLGTLDHAKTAIDSLLVASPGSALARCLQGETHRYLSRSGIAAQWHPVLTMMFIEELWWPDNKAALVAHGLESLRAVLLD